MLWVLNGVIHSKAFHLVLDPFFDEDTELEDPELTFALNQQ